MPIVAAPIVAAGIGAIANGIGNFFGNKSRRREASRARTHDINMWDKTNAYNDPKAQMERLRQAGLNPNLVYGGSSGQTAGTANSLPGAKSPDIQNTDISPQLMSYIGMKNTEAQTDNLRTQNGVLTADKILKTAQASTELSKQTDLSASAEYKKSQVQKALQDILQSQSQTEKLNAETGNIRKEGVYKSLENKRAKQGQLRGDDASKVIMNMMLSVFNRQNPQFKQ
tara:strand:- start:755 stop:1435 length:681 start_codon:yes stop_codon:yes gene_type:complete